MTDHFAKPKARMLRAFGWSAVNTRTYSNLEHYRCNDPERIINRFNLHNAAAVWNCHGYFSRLLTSLPAYRLDPVEKTGADTRSRRPAIYRPLGTNGKVAVRAFRLPLTPYLTEDGEQHEAR